MAPAIKLAKLDILRLDPNKRWHIRFGFNKRTCINLIRQLLEQRLGED
jgi:hypothetical protein